MNLYICSNQSKKTGNGYICLSYELGGKLFPLNFKLEDILCFTKMSASEVKALPIGSKILVGSFVADKGGK